MLIELDPSFQKAFIFQTTLVLYLNVASVSINLPFRHLVVSRPS